MHALQSIETYYIPASNTKPTRIAAVSATGRKVVISQPMDTEGVDSHLAAARALCAKMDWHGTLIAGGTKRGYVFSFLTKEKCDRVTV